VQICDSLSVPHAAPPLDGATSTLRVRRCSPVPHACEHWLHVDHELSWQSTAHAGSAHASLTSVVGHGVPPHKASLVIWRVRRRTAAPQVAEHTDHVDHVDTEHAIGQQPTPQLVVSVSVGHGTPPFLAATDTVRKRDIMPEPHVTEHDDHCDHVDTEQSTAGSEHAGWVQARVSDVACAHEPPHDSDVVTERVRVKRPLPHVTEQVDDCHDVHAPYAQSTGQQPPLEVHDAESDSGRLHVPPH
jgi:hypothetical protein